MPGSIYLILTLTCLFQILSKIDNCHLKNKSEYSDILRAVLSNSELGLIELYSKSKHIKDEIHELSRTYIFAD